MYRILPIAARKECEYNIIKLPSGRGRGQKTGDLDRESEAGASTETTAAATSTRSGVKGNPARWNAMRRCGMRAQRRRTRNTTTT